MVNIPPVPVNTEVRTALIPDVSKIWKVGQALNAIAARNANANDVVLIRMGQTVLEARTPIALKAGDPLRLLVKSLGDTPVLTIQTSTPTPQIAAENLRSFIARQQDLTGLLAVSQQLVASPWISRKLKQQLVELNQQLPDPEEVAQAKSLKKLIQNSGIFLESKLNALQTDSLGQDIKSQLLRIDAQLQNLAPGLLEQPRIAAAHDFHAVITSFLAGKFDLRQLAILLTNHLSKKQRQIIQQALTSNDDALLPKKLPDSFTLLLNYILQQENPRLIRERLSDLLKTMGLLQELKSGTNGALAKITAQQLTPITRETDSPLLLFDLYFADEAKYQLINFRLEKHKTVNHQSSPGWTITLNFDFRELGPLQAELNVSDNGISTVFRAERKDTADRLSEHIKLLENAFENIGFESIKLVVTQGSSRQHNDLAEGIQILDEKA